MKYENVALNITEILLPDNSVDMTKWAAVACDQFTSQPDYWEKAYEIAGASPSALKLILPELYLEDDNVAERIKEINAQMNEYVANGTLRSTEPCMMLIKRYTSASPCRTGIVVALDLEHYSFEKGATTLIRATEGTVTERIPPRMKVRKNACVELPHIMILIDDPKLTAIEEVARKVSESNDDPIYSFELMMDGGSIDGWKITDKAIIDDFAKALSGLADQKVFDEKYNVSGYSPLLYAVGDGNHSLASAKCHWEELKKQGADMTHPARYALVELVNVHDQGIIFEPIHRVIFGTDIENFTDSLTEFFGGNASYVSTPDIQTEIVKTADAQAELPYHAIPVCSEKEQGIVYIDKTVHTLAVGAIQQFIDEYLKNHNDVKVDYIHGEDVTTSLGKAKGNLGILLPPMNKSDLFLTVIKNGSLPRKTFSMGEAFEKRYYVEARKIKEL